METWLIGWLFKTLFDVVETTEISVVHSSKRNSMQLNNISMVYFILSQSRLKKREEKVQNTGYVVQIYGLNRFLGQE